MAIKVLINGAFGRMGQLTSKTLKENAHFDVVGQTGREYDLHKSIKDSKADVVIDFTRADAVYQNTLTIIESGARPVIGTSGLLPDQIKKLNEKCAELSLGAIIAPNFSLGAVLMLKSAKEIIQYLPHVEIIEMHHENKVDSPSGTAMRSAEVLSALLPSEANETDAHETIKGARGANFKGISIHAIRLPGFLAREEIIFGNRGETLTITHNAIDRESFMPGVVFACKKVMELNHLVYGLEELL